MPKYYVKSAKFRLVTTARDSKSAAIWAVHRTLSRSLPFLCEDSADYLELSPLTHLGESLQVSQRGFDNPASETFETLDIVSEWNQLLTAIDRLHERLERVTVTIAD
jgi:hypothetical protein